MNTEESLEAQIDRLGASIQAEDGDVLIRQGERDSYAYRLLSGALEIFTSTGNEDVRLARIEAPALIGEIAALAGISRTASVRALGPASLKRIPSEALRELGRVRPELLERVIHALGSKINEVNGALSIFTGALAELERGDAATDVLKALSQPPPEMAAFSSSFLRFAKEISAKRKTQEELASAALIQRSFLPAVRPGETWPGGLTIEAKMRPARQVGGDLYDIQRLDDRHVLVVVGDVCGKGMPASLFMSVAITTLRSVAARTHDAGEIAAAANTLLCAGNANSLFATAIVAVIDAESRSIAYSNCGHCPLLRLSTTGELSAYGKTGLPLGLFADRSPTAQTLTLDPGDRLLLYSDGITEANDVALAEFGQDRLEEVFRGCLQKGASEIVTTIISAADDFAAGMEQADDITCLAIAIPRSPGNDNV